MSPLVEIKATTRGFSITFILESPGNKSSHVSNSITTKYNINNWFSWIKISPCFFLNCNFAWEKVNKGSFHLTSRRIWPATKNNYIETPDHLADGLICSYRGISIKLRLFQNQLKTPCSSFKLRHAAGARCVLHTLFVFVSLPEQNANTLRGSGPD